MKQWLLSVKALVLCLAIVLTPSCGKEVSGLPEINGVKGPMLNIVDGQILLTMKFLNVSVDAGIKAPIPETKHSFLEFSPNVEDGGMMLQLYIDADDLRSINIGVGDGNTLPDGRPVPGIPGGRLENSLRVDTPWYDLSFFFHKKLFGVWMPFGFETAGISGYWNMNFGGKNIGFLGIVGNDPVRDLKAGGVILLRLDNLLNKEVQMLLEKSKRNPHMIY